MVRVRVDEWRRGEAPFPSVRVSPTTILDLVDQRPNGVNVDHICLVLEPTDLDALIAEFPGSHLADRVYGAQGLGVERVRHRPRRHDRRTALLPRLTGVYTSPRVS